jgi:hypothetical protein
MSNVAGRTGRVPLIALACAAVWAIGLWIAGFVVPVYESAVTSSSGTTASADETLVGANGWGVAVVLALPLLATLGVAGALLLPSRARPWAAAAAWTITGLLAALTLVSMLTIGIFVLPVTAALVVACARRPAPGGTVAAGEAPAGASKLR